MARDNSPKERQRKQLERRKASRPGHDRILVVTEGSKTEPGYFTEIRKSMRLQTASIMVLPSQLGTAPLQVVQHARDIFMKGDKPRIAPRTFDRIFAVFDRDSHLSYFDALSLAKSLDGKLKNDEKQAVAFTAIASVPSFELWLLLHYEDVLAAVERDDTLRRLQQHLKGYEKGSKDVYQQTCGLLDTAMARAEALAGRFNAHTEPEPYTGVFELVRLLLSQRG